MARSKGRSGGKSANRSTSRKAAPAAELEVVEEAGGLKAEDGVIIVTFVLLLVAILFVDYDMGENYGEGVLFKGDFGSSAASE